jgi:hypothetical protein
MYVGSREGEAPEVRPAEVISAKPDQLLAIPQFIRFYDPVDKKTWIIFVAHVEPAKIAIAEAVFGEIWKRKRVHQGGPCE